MRPGEAAFKSEVPFGIEFALWHLRRLLHLSMTDPYRGTPEYVLFGSTVLYLHGIRTAESVGDVDVFVSREVWGELLAEGPEVCTVETPRAGDPPYLEIALERAPIHVFYEWTARDASWITAEECFESAEMVNGWRCTSLAEIRRHKSKAFEMNANSELHAKHASDLKLIDARLMTPREHAFFEGEG